MFVCFASFVQKLNLGNHNHGSHRLAKDIRNYFFCKKTPKFWHGSQQSCSIEFIPDTGKSSSEALILAPTNPQYEKRFFIKLRVQYMKTTSSVHGVHINCSEQSAVILWVS